MKALSAQRGYFVAKSVSSYAEAQAKKDRRLTILRATELPFDLDPLPFHFNFITTNIESTDVEVHPSGDVAASPREFNIVDSEACINGATERLADYIRAWAKEAAKRRADRFPSAHKADGVYNVGISEIRKFGPAECIIDGIPARELRLHGRLSIDIATPAIVSHFDIETRGRVLMFAKQVLATGEWIEFGLVGGLPR